MIASTLVAATLAAAQPQSAPVPPPMDHGKTAPIKIEIGAAGNKGVAPAAKMNCCKDGCACCAKDKPAA